jgi:hypothetical protein
MSEQLRLTEHPRGGRQRHAAHPWGMARRQWELARKYLRIGVPARDAVRLAGKYPRRLQVAEAMRSQRALGAPAIWIREEPMEDEATPLDGLRVVFRLDCSPELRRRIRAGQIPGIEWRDFVGGVLVRRPPP